MAFVRIVLPLVLCALASFAANAYEITFPADDSSDGAPTTFLYPINARMWALDMYGTRCGAFWADARAPSVFRSAMPNRLRDGGSVLPDGTIELTLGVSGAIAGTFKNGRLVSYKKDGDDVAKGRASRFLGAKLPRKKIMRAFRRRPDHSQDGKWYWRDSGRLRLWYNNPNAAGTLFAELGILALVIALSARRLAVRMVGGVLCAGALFAIWATGSRGSFLAFVLAAVVVGAVMAMHMGKRRLLLIVSCALVVGLLALALVYIGAGNRIQLDGSSSERLKIWRNAPQMMAAAPEGWKVQTGYAWCDWYEPQDDNFCTVWMVNSHLCRLTQRGTAFRLFYIFAWIFLFLSLGAVAFKTGRSTALAEWLGFAVAQWFSTVGHFPALWIVPTVSLLALSPLALKALRSGSRRTVIRAAATIFVVSALLSCGVLWGLLCVGERLERKETQPSLVRRMSNGVKIGYGEPIVFLVHDNFVLTGGEHGVLGKEIRAYYQEHPDIPAMFIADSISDLPPNVEVLVLAGEAADAYLAKRGGQVADESPPVSAKRLVLISPGTDWADLPKGLGDSSVRYIMGEFALRALKSAKRDRPPWVECVSGAAIYPPDWLDRIFGQSKTPTTRKE